MEGENRLLAYVFIDLKFVFLSDGYINRLQHVVQLSVVFVQHYSIVTRLFCCSIPFLVWVFVTYLKCVVPVVRRGFKLYSLLNNVRFRL